MVEIGADDRPVSRAMAEVNRTAIAIHGALHRARPDVRTAIHARSSTAAPRITPTAALPADASLVMPDAATCDHAAAEQNAGTMQADGTLLPAGHREWPAPLRLLDVQEPGWRD